VVLDMTGTPSGRADWLQADAEDQPTELLASRLRAGYPGLPMRSGASIEPGSAEVAVTVADRYQGRGIGRLLVQALRPAAVRAGLTSLVLLVEPINRPALRLLRSLGVELAFRDGLVEGRQRLPPRGSDPTMVREVAWETGTSA
jgi:ribosomal protein S18 acetylase RimI-like enzyme